MAFWPQFREFWRQRKNKNRFLKRASRPFRGFSNFVSMTPVNKVICIFVYPFIFALHSPNGSCDFKGPKKVLIHGPNRPCNEKNPPEKIMHRAVKFIGALIVIIHTWRNWIKKFLHFYIGYRIFVIFRNFKLETNGLTASKLYTRWFCFNFT